jgi:hypothetical protein
MLKRTVVALSIAALSVAGVAAQVNATFILRSGERLSGQLVDLSGSGFTVRINDQERKIRADEMALIDFSGSSSMSQADWDRLGSGQHVIWLRNGQTITGQLYDLGGTTPLRITVKSDGGERKFSSDEISRIALARPNNAVPTTGGSQGQGVTVSARQAWTPTGITVRGGEWITFRADGEIRIGGPDDRTTASGVVAQRFDPRAPLPRTLAGALIGRVGNSQPFGIGTENRIQAPASGQLFLGINESNLSDNDGEFRVTIERAGAPMRRR